VLGDLTYEYDSNGNRAKTGGSFARTGIPSAISSTAYDAANEQKTFGAENENSLSRFGRELEWGPCRPACPHPDLPPRRGKELFVTLIFSGDRVAKLFVGAVVLLLAIWTPGICSGIDANFGLKFRRVVGDKRVPPGDLSNVFVVQDHSRYLYVERKLSFEVPPDEIKSFTIEKTPTVYPKGARIREDEKTFYQVTVLFSREMMRRFAIFANNNDQQSFELSLGTTRLGIVTFVLLGNRFNESSKATFSLALTDPNDIKKAFAPFEKIVVWK
jgi:hypothetical protein